MSIKKVLAPLGILIALAVGWIGYIKFEGDAPRVTVEGIGDAIRGSHDCSLTVADPESGIREIRISLSVKDTEHSLYLQAMPAVNFFVGGQIYEKSLRMTLKPEADKIPQGQAVLRIAVRDYSWRDFWRGNQTLIERPVILDYQPPVIQVLSKQHNVSLGGSGVVVYRLSEPCAESGVVVDGKLFKGYPADKVVKRGDGSSFVSFMAIPHDAKEDIAIRLKAVDAAGNASETDFYHHVRSQVFKQDTIPITDAFLSRKLAEFDLILKGKGSGSSPLEKFLIINRELRTEDAQEIVDITSRTTEAMYWEGAFLRLDASARQAGFADHRTYTYNAKEIDKQVHLGIDLASTARAPVAASNAGEVVFVGYIGIYGETVVIDHGLGLFTTYSHLSQSIVQKGQMVKKGDVLGNTGTSGLAVGDHLHFGTMIHGTFVNPVEWWDARWIKSNVLDKLDLIK